MADKIIDAGKKHQFKISVAYSEEETPAEESASTIGNIAASAVATSRITEKTDLPNDNKKTQPGSSVANSDKKQKTYICDWKNCKGHPEDINHKYRNPEGNTNRGNATSGKDYETEWIYENLEPWQLYGNGNNPRATYDDFAKDNDPSKPWNENIINKALNDVTYPAYVTQKHHLISVNLFDSVPELAHNAKLVGYNVNDKENGVCLPYFKIDIVQHNLQCHRGSHPAAYNEKILLLLKTLQKKSISYCQSDNQYLLKEKINKISERILDHINNWRPGWYLTSSALSHKKWAYEQIAKKGKE